MSAVTQYLSQPIRDNKTNTYSGRRSNWGSCSKQRIAGSNYSLDVTRRPGVAFYVVLFPSSAAFQRYGGLATVLRHCPALSAQRVGRNNLRKKEQQPKCRQRSCYARNFTRSQDTVNKEMATYPEKHCAQRRADTPRQGCPPSLSTFRNQVGATKQIYLGRKANYGTHPKNRTVGKITLQLSLVAR